MQFLADVNFPHFEIGGNLMILLIVIVALTFRLCIGFLHHKQIMTAIEKGIPLNEIKPDRKNSYWILSTAIGAGLLVFACLIFLVLVCDFPKTSEVGVLIICAAVGSTLLVYGLLSRKQIKQTPPEESNTP